MRRAQPDALRRHQQLDAENGGKIIRHIRQPARGVRGHRHMIFLVGAGRRRIDRAGRGALLVLGIERGRRHFGNHEAGVDARLGVRNGGRPKFSAGSTSVAMRRSLIAPISDKASAIWSAAKATGSA